MACIDHAFLMFGNPNMAKEEKYKGYPKRIIPANDPLFDPKKPAGMVERKKETEVSDETDTTWKVEGRAQRTKTTAHVVKRWAVPSYATNFVRTTKYTIFDFLPKTLFDQFRRAANFYFLVLRSCGRCDSGAAPTLSVRCRSSQYCPRSQQLALPVRRLRSCR